MHVGAGKIIFSWHRVEQSDAEGGRSRRLVPTSDISIPTTLGKGFLFTLHYVSIESPSNQWASYQIRKIAGCACAGNAGNVFPRRRFQRKLLVSDPGMHHGTCVTHVPWCMSGSLTCGDGENVPGIPSACAAAILRIWQEAHEYITATILCRMDVHH